MPFTELTSNQFIGGMKKVFELQPFIDVYKNTNYHNNAAGKQIASTGC